MPELTIRSIVDDAGDGDDDEDDDSDGDDDGGDDDGGDDDDRGQRSGIAAVQKLDKKWLGRA